MPSALCIMFRVFRFGRNNVYIAVKVLPRSHADDLTSSEFAPRFYCWRTRGLRINRTRHSRTRTHAYISPWRRIIYMTTRKQILIFNKKEWLKNVLGTRYILFKNEIWKKNVLGSLKSCNKIYHKTYNKKYQICMHKHLFIPCLCKKNIHTYVKRTRLMLTYYILKFLFCKINIYCEVKVNRNFRIIARYDFTDWIR